MVGSLGWEDALEKEMATHSSLENPMNRGAWWAAVHGVTNSQTRLSNQHTHTSLFTHGAYDSGISCLTSFLEEEKKERLSERKAVGLRVQSPLSLAALGQG